MARSRNIKPGFFVNADLVELPALVRLLFIGLWTIADREGRLEDRPAQIKMQVLPGDEIDTVLALDLLHTRGFLIRYEVRGKRYIQITNFLKHQNPHMKEPKSVIPPPFEPIEITEGNTDTIPASCKHRTCLVLAGLIPDSLNLIPDSLIDIGQGDKSPPPSSLMSLWNEIVQEPKVTVLSKTREAKCRIRLKDRSLEEWRAIFDKIKNTPFLCGDNDRGWRADFDWVIVNDTNCVKVLEGKYDKPNISDRPRELQVVL